MGPHPFGADIIGLALAEDIGDGDATAEWFCDPSRVSTARIVAREACCLAGTGVARTVFDRVDAALEVSLHCVDGQSLAPGDVVLDVRGPTGSILTAERTALNFLQRLSGIATITRAFVSAVEGTGARILDTRKTTPGLRLLEKAAVAAAGGSNHRLGLHDMVLIKDNHLAAGLDCAGLQQAIDRLRAARPGMRVEIEADTLGQAREFFTLRGVDVVLLDNMSLADLRAAVAARPSHIRLEASGGVTLETVRAIAETGVDDISVGALTHSARAIDFSLDLD